MLSLLDTPLGSSAEGWRKWNRYWDEVHFEQRRKDLAANPYYSASPTRD